MENKSNDSIGQNESSIFKAIGVSQAAEVMLALLLMGEGPDGPELTDEQNELLTSLGEYYVFVRDIHDALIAMDLSEQNILDAIDGALYFAEEVVWDREAKKRLELAV